MIQLKQLRKARCSLIAYAAADWDSGGTYQVWGNGAGDDHSLRSSFHLKNYINSSSQKEQLGSVTGSTVCLMVSLKLCPRGRGVQRKRLKILEEHASSGEDEGTKGRSRSFDPGDKRYASFSVFRSKGQPRKRAWARGWGLSTGWGSVPRCSQTTHSSPDFHPLRVFPSEVMGPLHPFTPQRAD